jgi:hypothetical protein
MATIDFTDRLRDMEEQLRNMPAAPPRYKKVLDGLLIPGLEIELFVNEQNPDDIYLSPGFCCELVGLSRKWLGGAYARMGTMQKLAAFGMSPEKRFVDVLVPNSPTRMTRACLVIDRAGLDALIDYACELGKPKAIAIRNTFMVTALTSIAGFAQSDEEYRRNFQHIYTKCLSELEAE